MTSELTLLKLATCCISVQGAISRDWKDYFRTLSVSTASPKDYRPVTTLTGLIGDAFRNYLCLPTAYGCCEITGMGKQPGSQRKLYASIIDIKDYSVKNSSYTIFPETVLLFRCCMIRRSFRENYSII